jgi:hypothetical protein
MRLWGKATIFESKCTLDSNLDPRLAEWVGFRALLAAGAGGAALLTEEEKNGNLTRRRDRARSTT